MQALHQNQQKILNYLMDHKDGATLEDLASHLGITKTAAKEHLLRVEALGYISFLDTRGSVGRPKRKYFLSPQGQEAFPKKYAWLSNVLLELLAEDLGHEEVGRIMTQLADKITGSMKERFERTKNNPELLAEVTSTLNELGYRANLKQSDLRKGAIIEATHCVYHNVAKAHPTLCRFDVRFIEKATNGMKVELQTCIARGGDVCRFCIRKK